MNLILKNGIKMNGAKSAGMKGIFVTLQIVIFGLLLGSSAHGQTQTNGQAQAGQAQPTDASSPLPATPANTPAATNGSAPSGLANTSKGGNTQLSTVVVQGVSPEQSVLPIRPTSSVNGIEATVQDTPR